MSNIIPIILVVVMIIIAAFFRGLLWEYGRRFGDKYYSFIINRVIAFIKKHPSIRIIFIRLIT